MKKIVCGDCSLFDYPITRLGISGPTDIWKESITLIDKVKVSDFLLGRGELRGPLDYKYILISSYLRDGNTKLDSYMLLTIEGDLYVAQPEEYDLMTADTGILLIDVNGHIDVFPIDNEPMRILLPNEVIQKVMKKHNIDGHKVAIIDTV